jgi:hypothetical protein
LKYWFWLSVWWEVICIDHFVFLWYVLFEIVRLFWLSTISDSYILLLFLIVKNKLLICNNYLSGSVYVLVVFKIIFLLVLNKSKASYYLVVANSRFSVCWSWLFT